MQRRYFFMLVLVGLFGLVEFSAARHRADNLKKWLIAVDDSFGHCVPAVRATCLPSRKKADKRPPLQRVVVADRSTSTGYLFSSASTTARIVTGAGNVKPHVAVSRRKVPQMKWQHDRII